MAENARRQSSFHSGEWSPEAAGRFDLDARAFALARSRNGIVGALGRWKNRPGFQYLGTVYANGSKSRLVTFTFSSSLAYVIEISGAGWIRFWYQGALVGQPAPGTLPAYSGATTYARGTWVQSGGFSYVSLQDGNLAHTPGSSPTWWAPSAIYQVASPYADGDLERLRFAQVGDVVTITHPSHTPRELTRISTSSWTLSTVSFVPPAWPPPGDFLRLSPYADSPLPAGSASEPARGWFWLVTAIVRTNAGQVYESTPFEVTHSATYAGIPTVPTTTALPAEIPVYLDKPVSIRMRDLQSGLVIDPGYRVLAYRVYRGLGRWQREALAGWVGDMIDDGSDLVFKDVGITPDYARQPPMGLNPFEVRGYDDSLVRTEEPSTVAFWQLRRAFGGTAERGDEAWLSKLNEFSNFDRAAEPTAEDAIDLVLAAYEREEVRALLGLDDLLIGTTRGWWRCRPADGEVVAPGAVEVLAPEGWRYGLSELDALVAGGKVLFVQEKGGVVRVLERSQDGHQAPDVSIFSRHLFDGHSLVDRAWLRDPHELAVWVREDGIAPVLTWKPEAGVGGWGWWDTRGTLESVTVAPEGGEDRLYAVVRRTLNGVAIRTVERLASRAVTSRRRGVFLDCSLTYDGTHTGGLHAQVFDTGAGFDPDASAALFVGGGSFSAGDVGKQVILDPEGAACRLEITGYTDPETLTVLVLGPGAVPAAFRGYPGDDDWAIAVQTITGLGHLNGETVTALADGAVVRGLLVAAGQVTLGTPAAMVHVGFEYDAEGELLDVVDEKHRQKNVARVWAEVSDTAAFSAGQDLEHLTAWQGTEDLNAYGHQDLVDTLAEVIVEGAWQRGGRVAFKAVDPVPFELVAITREFDVGGS